MKINYLSPTHSTMQRQPLAVNRFLLPLTIALIAFLGIAVSAQQQPSVKITPKTTTPAAKPKTTTPVTVKPIGNEPTTAKKPVTTEKPAQAAQQSTALELAPGDIIRDVILIIDGRVMNAGDMELIRGQQMMVWIRDLERLGWGVVSADPSGKVSLTNDNVKLTFMKNQDTAMVNSLAVKLPIQTYLRDDKLMVPLSFVAKSMGFEYECSFRAMAFVISNDTLLAEYHKNSPKATVGNTLKGQVVFNGKPLAGVKIRTVDKDLMEIEGARAVTNANGNFAITNLPDGDYAAYAFIGDNPDYFNRATEIKTVSGNKTFDLKPLSLGKVLKGISPASGESVKSENDQVSVSWTPLEGAAEYRLSIKTSDGVDVQPLNPSRKPNMSLKADNLNHNNTYTLEVTAYDANGEFIGGTPGAGAEPWTFVYVGK